MADIPAGALISDDGHYWWDGTQWQPTAGQSPQSPTQASAGPHGSASAIGQVSDDGYWQWDGTKWQATRRQSPDPSIHAAPPPVHPEKSPAETEREREITRGTRESSDGYSWLSDFTSDWAGREILVHYLEGDGKALDIDRPDWADYMRANELLRHTLEQHVRHIIADAAARPLSEKVSVAESFHAEVENGEGIIGYQYLHGTSRDVGDFTINGWAEHLPGHDPADTGHDTRVHYDLTFVWNDWIHPNLHYESDDLKSRIARLLTNAKPYRISIKWTGECLVTVGASGNVEEISPVSADGSHLNCYPLQK